MMASFVNMFLAVFGIICAYHADALKLTGSWSLCKGADATECPLGKYANLTTEILPATFPIGSNFTITAVANSFVNIDSPSISISSVDGTLMNTIVFYEGCGKHKYIFPLDDGVLYYDGLSPSCPISVGPLNMTFTASISSLGWRSPDGTGVVTVKLYDKPNQEGNCVLCTVTTLTMTGH